MKKRAAVLLLAVLLIINSSTTSMAAASSPFPDLSGNSPADDLYAGFLAPLLYEISPFTDVSSRRWSYPYVSDLFRLGVVDGYPDGSFHPKGSVTYGEAFKLILLAIGVPEPAAQAGQHWAYPYIQLAVDHKLVSSFSAADLDTVPSRLDVARMTARALELANISGESPYADCDDGYVTKLYEKGIMNGFDGENGTQQFCPDKPIVREEMAAVIWRVMNTDVTQGMFRYSGVWLDVLDGVPLTSFTEDQFGKDSKNRVTYNGGYFVRGVDVSGYQQTINWKSVAGDGIDFAIIRAGGRFYGRSGSGDVYEDSYFDQNMQGAIDAGLAVGAYFFSNAVTVEEAIEEADLLLSRLEPYRAYVTYPVVCDWEYLGGNNSRAYGVDAKIITECIDAFCRRVEEAGYIPMLYFNQYCGYIKMDLSKLTRYRFWYAEYADHPSCVYDFQFWQYSSSGKVAGISSGVDMDLCFIPYAFR